MRDKVRPVDVGGDPDWIESAGPRSAPEGKKFKVFGRVDKKYYGGNAWTGISNLLEGVDWHAIDPPMIVKQLPQGVGWLYVLFEEVGGCDDETND